MKKDFSRSLEMTTTVIPNKVRDLLFLILEGAHEGREVRKK